MSFIRPIDSVAVAGAYEPTRLIWDLHRSYPRPTTAPQKAHPRVTPHKPPPSPRNDACRYNAPRTEHGRKGSPRRQRPGLATQKKKETPPGGGRKGEVAEERE